MRNLIFVSAILATMLLAAAVYFALQSKSAVLFFAEHQTSTFSAVPKVTTTPLDSQPHMTLVGNGQEGDPCTALVHTENLSKLEDMGVRDWVDRCEEELSETD